jgi:hydrogenase nickel incorporation protein HypA/HybF
VHELAAVGALVEAALSSLPAERPARVELLRVRRGSAFSEEALRQGFDLLAHGTALAGARLEIEMLDQTVKCRCGRSARVTPEDLIGHMYVCSECGHVEDVAGADDLTLLQVVVGDGRPAP